jgi:hypothetical protein
MIGVDHFYLYNNGSTDRFVSVLMPYIKQGLVTLTHWSDRVPNRDDEDAEHWALSTQLPAYEHANKFYAVNESQWLVILDIDEFMVPVHADSVCEVLENNEGCPGLELICDYFDASEKDPLSKKELLISNFDLTNRPVQNVLKRVVKTIFRPEDNTHFTWPPYKCNFKEGQTAGKLTKSQLRINKYVGRSNGQLNFEKIKQKLRIDSRSLSDIEKNELLEVGYQIEDKERVINRFEPGLRKRMGIEAGWKLISD